MTMPNGLTALENRHPGLFIGGNARDGISLANCIESGRRLADCASAFVQARQALAAAP